MISQCSGHLRHQAAGLRRCPTPCVIALGSSLHRFASCCTGLNSRITFVTQMTQISEGSGKLGTNLIGRLGVYVRAVGLMACVFALATPWSPWTTRTRRAQTSAFWR
jgi:hypothetical protein